MVTRPWLGPIKKPSPFFGGVNQERVGVMCGVTILSLRNWTAGRRRRQIARV